MKKKIGSLLVLFSSIALVVGALFNCITKGYKISNAAGELSSKIINVQLRYDPNPSMGGFLVIVDENITATESGNYNKYQYNAHNNIRLYYQANSEDEVEIVTLNDVIGTTIRFNEWSCGGIMFSISDYEKYNGATIKAVEILEGCTYPNQYSSGATKIVNATTVKYVNRDHLDLDKKYGALEHWVKEEKHDKTETKISLVRPQIRADLSDKLFYFCLETTAIDVAKPEKLYDYADDINAFDKIKLYKSENDAGKTIGEIVGPFKSAIQNRWVSRAFHFVLSEDIYKEYNNCSVYKITIEAGCELIVDEKIVTISDSYAFKNNNYNPSASYDSNVAIGLTEEGDAPNFDFDLIFDKSEEKLDIFRAEVRGDENSDDDFYLDLGCYDFAGTIETSYLSVNKYINAYEKIIVYVNESDEGKPLSEITTSRDAVINKWESKGFMFHIDKANYELYNGETITRIQVLEGLELIFENKIYTLSSSYNLYKSDVIPDDPDHLPNKYYACYFASSEIVYEPIEISLTGAHVRGDAEHHQYFIDIIADNYFTAPEKEYFNLNSLNAYQYIKVYISPTDEGTLLSDVVGSSKGKGSQNKWNSFAFMFEVEENLYENTFNGETIYMIEILKGCEFYFDSGEQVFIAVVDNTYRYCNVDWNDGKPNEHKYMASDFRPDVNNLQDFGTIGITNVHNRMGRTNAEPEEPIINRWIIICLDSYIYDFQMQVNYWINKLNFLDNILIYPSKDSEPYKLREIYDKDGTGIEVKQFNERDYLGISISNEKIDDKYKYDGSHMYMISFEAGTQIPTYENGQPGYRVIPDKTVFMNEEYGKTGPNYDALDDNGNARLYEEWNIKWRIIPCTVTFTVVGIEGLSFKNVYLEYGERLYLKDYEVDGYKLIATTSKGDKIYNCIIGSNKNFDVILTYSQDTGEPPEEEPDEIDEPDEPVEPETPDDSNTNKANGCAGNIILDSASISILAIAGITLVIMKRRGRKHDEK